MQRVQRRDVHFVVETQEPRVQIDWVPLEDLEEDEQSGRLPIVAAMPFACGIAVLHAAAKN